MYRLLQELSDDTVTVRDEGETRSGLAADDEEDYEEDHEAS